MYMRRKPTTAFAELLCKKFSTEPWIRVPSENRHDTIDFGGGRPLHLVPTANQSVSQFHRPELGRLYLHTRNLELYANSSKKPPYISPVYIYSCESLLVGLYTGWLIYTGGANI